nr:hypothetical protein BaRGS_005555 [Batillaria attramentaria]
MFLFWALVGLCATTATLPWCVPYSALGTFYFTGFVFVGSLETGVVRIMALLLPQWVSDETFLVSSCASLVCSLAGLHFSMTYTLDSGVWVCVLLIGISTSLVTPLTFSWLHTALMQASSAASVSAVVMVASSMAGVLSPLILSHVMQRHSLKWFAYLLLLESGVSLLLLFLMILVSRTLLISWQGVDTDVTMDKTDDTTSVDN